MRIYITFIFVSAFFFSSPNINAQSSADTIQARKYQAIGDKYYNEELLDSSTCYYQKAANVYKVIAEARGDTVLWGEYLTCLCNISRNSSFLFKLDNSKQTLDTALTISLKLFGKDHRLTALIYGGYGQLYKKIPDFDLSQKYLIKQLEIYKKIFNGSSDSLAIVYKDIGEVFFEKGVFNKALEYYLKSIAIYKNNPGQNSRGLADTYYFIAQVYKRESEYDKSLEYLFTSLSISKELIGENNIDVASCYCEIGHVYLDKYEYDKGLEYYFKSLGISLGFVNGSTVNIATMYGNIGVAYIYQGDYDKASEYILKCMKITKEFLGEKHLKVGYSYTYLGLLNMKKKNFPLALDYYFKNLEIKLPILGEKNPQIVAAYFDIAKAYQNLFENNKAVLYYQKVIASCLQNFNDTVNLCSIPEIRDDSNWRSLLKGLQGKAAIFADSARSLPIIESLSTMDRLQIALKHYQACNKLIDMARKNISKVSDKMFLGEKASAIYEEAVGVCLKLADLGHPSDASGYNQLAFYFSEKGKSAVLLEAMAGQEAQKYAGIPDNLLEVEYNLQTDIAYYTKQLAGLGSADSLNINTLQKKLFDCNRSYDSLIVVFEKKYPKYHELKYSVNTASIKDIQNLIDKKTAMLSYFVGDSTVTVYTIAKNSSNIKSIKKPDDLGETVEFFRNSLTNQNKKSDKAYRKYGASLYEMLVPKDLDKNIGNLIIVPDGVLATIPFETLLTSKVADTTQFQNLPYLVKKYSISYCSSATLFKETFARKKRDPSEVRPLNDWIAYAPVFDDENSKGTSLASRALIRELHKINKDSTLTRGLMMGSGEVVPLLPGSENEVKSIFNEFDKRNLKTSVELKGNASERNIKSGELENYKYIHLATHGFVNSEKPELSGLLLAQVPDSTNEQNDGILYSGEIFNLKLNADLVVLSACETGLGKIKKGEGIIGLTRALLYAGAKNLVVSLWPVSDESTSDLMIDFYKNLLSEKSARLSNSVRFAPLMQQAKLKMIGEAKFAHPYFWSPFILIGQ